MMQAKRDAGRHIPAPGLEQDQATHLGILGLRPIQVGCCPTQARFDLASKFALGSAPIAEGLPVEEDSRREENAPALCELKPSRGVEVDGLNLERVLGLET